MDKDPLVNELDASDANGMTPLLNAIFIGDTEKVQRLLEMGADPNRRSSTGETPLWHAEEDFGLAEIARLLRQHGATAK
jgi:ankyrin repeat protein